MKFRKFVVQLGQQKSTAIECGCKQKYLNKPNRSDISMAAIN